MKIVSLVLFFLLLSTYQPTARASSNEGTITCQEALNLFVKKKNRIDKSSENKQGAATLASWTSRVGNETEKESPHVLVEVINNERKKYYFTQRTSFYYNFDCSSRIGRVNGVFDRVGFYGVGDIFLPEYEVKLLGRHYFFGKRESGLRAFVNINNLQEIEDDKYYIFNKHSEPVEFCDSEDYCGGSRNLNNKNTYIVHSSSGESPNNRIEDKIKSSTNDVQPSLRLNGVFYKCDYRECKEKPKSVFINYYLPQYKDSNGLKLVSYDSAKKQFESLPAFGDHYSAPRSFFDIINIELESRYDDIKDCNLVVDSSHTTQKYAEADIKFNYYFASFGTGGKKIISFSKNFSFERNKLYNFKYFTSELSLYDTGEKQDSVGDFLVVKNCQGYSAIDFDQFIIKFKHLNSEESHLIVVDRNEILCQYENFKGAFWEATSTSSSRRGKIWMIPELSHYKAWQELLQSAIKDDLVDLVDIELYPYYTNYFTDLVLALAFKHLSKEEATKIGKDGPKVTKC
ncbi:hypothetical protein [Enterovibrio baiacu]|uniref:hypothetical protein n=1 Tax=Enterovibrio baiacu TaxID=2491023 RepID=UPI003D138A40